MTTLQELKKRTVYFYSPGEISPKGSGSAIRQFTNLRAYLDLGFKVEVIQFIRRDLYRSSSLSYSAFDINWDALEYCPRPIGWLHRVAFYTGYPRSIVLELLFPVRPFVLSAVESRYHRNPKAIHHFEYIDTASAAVSFPGLASVWSCHDIFSRRVPLLWQMRSGEGLSMNRYRRTRIGRLRQAEDWVSRANTIIFNIALHENQEFVHHRGYNAYFFPLSWPDENPLERASQPVSADKLRLLHLGNVGGFLGFDSLSFLIKKVLPLLEPQHLARLELLVVGRMDESENARAIRALAQPFPQVKFVGFVDDIRKAYARADAQVVGGERATGMRTRIVESWVYGLPVISTHESARGLAYLQDGENILLAEDAQMFVRHLVRLIENPGLLDVLSTAGRETYDRYYARSVTAQTLAGLLEKNF